MAAKINCHRYGTKLHLGHCHLMYKGHEHSSLLYIPLTIIPDDGDSVCERLGQHTGH